MCSIIISKHVCNNGADEMCHSCQNKTKIELQLHSGIKKNHLPSLEEAFDNVQHDGCLFAKLIMIQTNSSESEWRVD